MKKITAFIVALAMCTSCAALGSCNKKNPKDNSELSSQSKASLESASDKQVKIKNYSFPESLKDNDNSELLTVPVYESFSKSEYVKPCTEQKFQGRETVDCFGEKYYSYKNGGFMGLLNSAGDELFSAEIYTDITAVSKNILEFSDNSGQRAYVLLGEDGSTTVLSTDAFDSGSWNTTEIVNTAQGKMPYRISYAGGVYVNFENSDSFENVTETDLKTLHTKKEFVKCYKAARKGKSYYVCFDKFGNFTVFNCEYAHINLKIGNDTADFYVQNPDDYSQLKTLTNSFGGVSTVNVAKSDEKSDFIQIEFGLNDKDKKITTISPDGICFTEKTNGDKAQNKYFSCVDKECFSSLVEWIDKTVKNQSSQITKSDSSQ